MFTRRAIPPNTRQWPGTTMSPPASDPTQSALEIVREQSLSILQDKIERNSASRVLVGGN